MYLSDAIVIMTSNIGSECFRRLSSPLGFYSKQVGVEQVQGEVARELERRFMLSRRMIHSGNESPSTTSKATRLSDCASTMWLKYRGTW